MDVASAGQERDKADRADGRGSRLGRRTEGRVRAALATGVALASLAGGASAVAGTAPTRSNYNYYGTTSQATHNGNHPAFRLDLERHLNGVGYRLTAEWGVLFPTTACSVLVPESRISANVAIHNSSFSLSSVSAAPDNGTVTNFTAHFTRGHVSGSFTDTVHTGAITCSTGTVTYTAHLI